MDRPQLEIAPLFDVQIGAKIENPQASLPAKSRLLSIAAIVVLHFLFALALLVALNGYPPNPNPTAILMLIGVSGVTSVLIRAYVELLRRVGGYRFGYMFSVSLLIGYEYLQSHYNTQFMFHIALCCFGALLIGYYVVLLPGRDDASLMAILVFVYGGNWYTSWYEKTDGHWVKFVAYGVVVIAAHCFGVYMRERVKAEKATESLKKIVDKDAGKI